MNSVMDDASGLAPGHLIVSVTVTGPDPKVLKSAVTPSSRAKDGTTSLSVTGIRIHQNYLLTSIVAIYPFLKLKDRNHPGMVLDPFCPLLPQTQISFSEPCTPLRHPVGQHAELERIIEIPGSSTALSRLLRTQSYTEWILGWDGSSSREVQLIQSSHCALLSIPDSANSITRGFDPLQCHPAFPGLEVILVGCPFGTLVNNTFHGFFTTGVISGALYSSESASGESEKQLESELPCVMLSDACCLPGMEGGCVLHAGTRRLIGVIGSPLRSVHSTEAQLATIIPIHSLSKLLARLSSYTFLLDGGSFINLQDPSQSPSDLHYSAAVVAVSNCGTGWGSGVLVTDKGHILTNAHVVPDTGRRPRVLLNTQHQCQRFASPFMTWIDARVLYVFNKIDLAIIQLEIYKPCVYPHPARLPNGSVDTLLPGTRVVAVGYPFWCPMDSALRGPLMTHGNIATMLHSVVLVTSSAVHSGASGGGIFDVTTGTLSGLISSNTKLAHSQLSVSIYPRLNYSIPWTLLCPVVQALQNLSGGHEHFDWAHFEKKTFGPNVSSVWSEKGVLDPFGGAKDADRRPPSRPPLPPALLALLQQKQQMSKL